MNLRDEIERLRQEGYNEANAEARLCQDIVLKAISKSTFSHNVTIKGGVVMRGRSRNVRRATRDLDLDFLRYSIEEESIRLFVDKLNCLKGLTLNMQDHVEELNHQDYKGKRVTLEVKDNFDNVLKLKLDIGVHKDLDIEQEEYGFDICFQEDGASVLINSSAQMFVEKLKSLLRFGPRSTRYKDIFDLYFLIDSIDRDLLKQCIDTYIFDDITLDVKNYDDIRNRIEKTFGNTKYKKQLERSKQNWIGCPIEDVLQKILYFIRER